MKNEEKDSNASLAAVDGARSAEAVPQLSHAAVLRDRARRLAMGYTERFELDAEQFYRDTGFIAPGKSVPLEMASDQADSRRDVAWRQWLVRQSALFAAALMTGADAIEIVDSLGPDAN